MTALKLLRAFAQVSASRCDGPSRPILQACEPGGAVGLNVLVKSLVGDGSFLLMSILVWISSYTAYL